MSDLVNGVSSFKFQSLADVRAKFSELPKYKQDLIAELKFSSVEDLEKAALQIANAAEQAAMDDMDKMAFSPAEAPEKSETSDTSNDIIKTILDGGVVKFSPAEAPKKSEITELRDDIISTLLDGGAANDKKVLEKLQSMDNDTFKKVIVSTIDTFMPNYFDKLVNALYDGIDSQGVSNYILARMSELAPDNAKFIVHTKRDNKGFHKVFVPKDGQYEELVKGTSEGASLPDNYRTFSLNDDNPDSLSGMTTWEKDFRGVFKKLADSIKDKDAAEAKAKAEADAAKAKAEADAAKAKEKAEADAAKAKAEAEAVAERDKASQEAIDAETKALEEASKITDKEAADIAERDKASQEAIEAENKAIEEASKITDKEAADIAKSKTIATSLDNDKFVAQYYFSPIGNISDGKQKDVIAPAKGKEAEFYAAAKAVAETMPKTKDGKLDLDAVYHLSPKAIDDAIAKSNEIITAPGDVLAVSDTDVKTEQAKLKAYQALKASSESFDKDMVEFNQAVTDVAMLTRKPDGTPDFDAVRRLTFAEIEKAAKENRQAYENNEAARNDKNPNVSMLAPEGTMEKTSQEYLAKAKAYERLKAAVYKNARLLGDGKYAFESEKTEPGITAKIVGGIIGGGAAVLKTVDNEIGVSEAFQAVDNSNARVWNRAKDGEYVKAPAQALGEFVGQGTSLVSGAGEHINKHFEDATKALDAAEEGKLKEVGQSAAAPVRFVNGAINLIGGVADIGGYYLRGGKGTNEKIDRMVKITTEQIAKEMTDDSKESMINKKTLIDIRQRLGVSAEELKAMGTDKVEQLIKDRVDEGIIPEELVLITYGQMTGEVTIDENGKLLLTGKLAGQDKLKRALSQFNDAVVDVANAPKAVTGLVNNGAENLDKAAENGLKKLGLGEKAAEITAAPTKVVKTVTGAVDGLGTVASGAAGFLTSAFTSNSASDSLKKMGNGIADTFTGGWWSRKSDAGKAAKADEAKAAQAQTETRKTEARDTDYRVDSAAAVAARKAQWRKECIEEYIDKEGKKLLDRLVPPETIDKYIKANLDAQLPELQKEIAAHLADADTSPEEMAAVTQSLAAMKCIQNPTDENKAALLKLYKQNNPNGDPNMTADTLIAQVKAEQENQVKAQMYEGLTALLRASASKEDARRLMTLAQNDAMFGEQSSFMKTLVNKIDEVYDQNEFTEDKNGFMKKLETVLVDGVLLEVPRLVAKESVSTMDKTLLTMVCLNFIGSATWMASGIKKGAKGAVKMANADYNPALSSSGLSQVAGGTAQTALGVGLSYIDCCAHLVLGKHKIVDEWLGHKVCCRKHHHKIVEQQVCPCKPDPKPLDPILNPDAPIVWPW